MELLSVQEAAKRAGVTDKAIYYSLKHGKLTPHKLYGRVLVDASEIGKHARRVASSQSNQSTKVIASPPSQKTRLLALLDKWLREDNEEDPGTYDKMKKIMDENPITFREVTFE